MNFLEDCWLMNGRLCYRDNIYQEVRNLEGATIREFIDANGNWVWSRGLSTSCPRIIREIEEEIVPYIECSDELIWTKSKSGAATIKDVYSELREKKQKVSWKRRNGRVNYHQKSLYSFGS